MSKKLTTEEFIEKAIKIHGNLYDYSLSIYEGSHKKIKIICREHGIFEQIPNSHLNKKGCRDCSIKNRNENLKYDTEIFIKKAQKVHGNKYSYANSIYLGSSLDIEIICLKHGSFWQNAGNHLFGQDCGNCSKNQKLTTEEFIQKAIQIHGNLYLYNNSIYKNSKKDIEIICRKHGSFWQKPNNHTNGTKCPNCSKESISLILRNDLSYFIEKASIVHNNKYSYLLTNYKNNKTKIDIICLKHKNFKQTPKSHLNGRGCPLCSNSSSISKPETEWLDFIGILTEYRQYKINIQNKLFKVDGYDPKTNTIYEHLGSYYHGDPRRFKPEEFNKKLKKTYGQLFKETMERIKLFQDHGYNVVYIWGK